MDRKRILLCRNQVGNPDSLLGLISHYFSSADNIFVNLQLKQDQLVSEAASANPIAGGTKGHHSAVKHPPRPRRFYRGYEASVRDIQREARFSDFLVVQDADYQTLYTNFETTAYPFFLSCPVLVAPAGEERVEQIILVDDGRPLTYQQIKYTACLFPKVCLATPTTLLIAHPPNKLASVQEEKLWVEYLKLHFAHLAVHRVDHRSSRILPTMVDYAKNALIICPTDALSAPLHKVLAPLKQFRLIQ